MDATEKKYLNSSSKKSDYSWLYWLVWLLLIGLLMGGVIFFALWWNKQQKINSARSFIYNVKNDEPTFSDKDYANARNLILSNEHQVKKLNDRINENPKKFTIWRKDLEKIKSGLITYLQLKQVKKDPLQLQKIYSQTHKQSVSLGRLEKQLFSDEYYKRQWEEQQKWLAEEAGQEENEAKEEIKKFMDHFYHLFYDSLPEEEKTPWNIEPILVKGEETPKDDFAHAQRKAYIDYLIAHVTDIQIQPLTAKWYGFTGFLHDSTESSKKEGKYTMGLTISVPKEGISLVTDIDPDYHKKGYRTMGNDTIFKYSKTSERGSKIKLKRELLFSRRNRYYSNWLLNEKSSNSLDISEDCLINTIAHELAHAVINATHMNYTGEDGGGHGDLHDDYTDKIEALIRGDEPRLEAFLAWWREPQTKNG